MLVSSLAALREMILAGSNGTLFWLRLCCSAGLANQNFVLPGRTDQRIRAFTRLALFAPNPPVPRAGGRVDNASRVPAVPEHVESNVQDTLCAGVELFVTEDLDENTYG